MALSTVGRSFSIRSTQILLDRNPSAYPNESRRDWQARLTTTQREELKVRRKAHRWHPHQLRHNAATLLRREFGLEAAQLALGHSSAEITDAVYAERDDMKAIEITRKIG